MFFKIFISIGVFRVCFFVWVFVVAIIRRYFSLHLSVLMFPVGTPAGVTQEEQQESRRKVTDRERDRQPGVFVYFSLTFFLLHTATVLVTAVLFSLPSIFVENGEVAPPVSPPRPLWSLICRKTKKISSRLTLTAHCLYKATEVPVFSSTEYRRTAVVRGQNFKTSTCPPCRL